MSIREYFLESLASLRIFCEARLVPHIAAKFAERELSSMKLSAQMRSAHNQDGAIVLDILHGHVFRANIVGSRILELLRRNHTEEQIAEELSRDFRVSRETLVADLAEFLALLKKHRLIELHTSGTPPAL